MRASKRLLSTLLALSLVVGLVPLVSAAASAEEAPDLTGFELVAGSEHEDATPTDELELIEAGDDAAWGEDTELGDAPILGDEDATDAETGEEVVPEEDALYEQASGAAVRRTQQDIRNFLNAHPFSTTAATAYDTAPSTTSPYAPGTLSWTSIQEGLNALNTFRYIAGLPYNVTNNTSYQDYAQAAALVNAVNGSLSHTPAQPSGMDATLYQTGYTGSSSSNLGKGDINPADAMQSYFDDRGANNHGTVGHRRWLLSPRLGQVGIGHVGSFNATYVFDRSDSSTTTDVAWPARVMPTEFFSSDIQWSFATSASLGSLSSIRVVRQRDGKVWNLSSSQVTANTGGGIGYIYDTCYVWDLEGVEGYRDGDVFDVTIRGTSGSKSYTVEFFDLYSVDDIEIRRDYLSNKDIQLADGETVNLIEGSGAQEFDFIPAYSADAYPQDERLQGLADTSRDATAISYSSSDESVVSVVPDREAHNAYYRVNGRKIWLDWVTEITPVGLGTATVTATLSNGRSYSLVFNVTKKSIDANVDANVTIYVYSTTMTYNGSAQHPRIAIRYSGSYLTEDTDYTITYKNDVNAGTGTATITGIGDYEGTYEVDFTINPAALSGATVSSVANQTYTGSALKPSPTVTWNGKTLKAGIDYTLSYSNNTNVGTATITLTGKGNFTGEKTTTFRIVPASLSGAVVTARNQTYTGNALTPAPTVKVGSKTLKKDTDYTVSYTNNTNAGTATVTVTGKGNYTDSARGTFTIAKADISAASVSVSDQTYTGSALKPAATVTLADRTLVADTDYTATYAQNTNAGTATVTIAGKGNYTGSVRGTFTIARASLSSATIATIADQTYTGSALKPALTVKLGTKTLKAGTDYTVAYAKNTNVGTATATITGKGNYTGTASKTFKVVAASIASASVSTIDAQTYTGSALKPAPTVTWNGTTLKAGTDYTLAYGSNVNVGTATITITGKGNFTGSTKVTFKIVPIDLSKNSLVVMEDKLTFTGKALTPLPSITIGANMLKKDTDYTLSYKSNTNVGTATVTITGKGNYTGTVSRTFKIVALKMSWVAVDAIASQTYTGSAFTPEPRVYYGEIDLVKDTDYTLTYADNINAGTASVVVKGKGNYSGSVKKTFVINKAEVAAPVAKKGLVYNGATQRGVATGALYTLTGTATAKKAGSFTATATLNDAANYQWTDGTSEPKAIAWSIAKAQLANASLSDIDTQTYAGEPLTPAPELKLGSYVLKAGTDYTLAYAQNLDAGTATITIKGKGSVSGTRTTTFEIVWPNPFSDVSESTSHADDILWLAAKGISAGWDESDGTKTFRPNDDVKRGDMAAFLFRLATRWGVVDESWQPSGPSPFVDVTDKTSHAREILWLADAEISTGWTVGTRREFRPNDKVKRGDMAAFMYRLAMKAGKTGGAPSSEDFFVDVQASTSFHDEIWWLAGNGVTQGWEVNGMLEFRPANTVKRGDMAAFLHRLDGLA